MNQLEQPMSSTEDTTGAIALAGSASGPFSTVPSSAAAMIKIPRPKFTMNRTSSSPLNGSHKFDNNNISSGKMSGPSSSASLSSSNSSNSSFQLYYPTTINEPPVDYWNNNNNNNSSSNTDLRPITKQLEKDCKI